MGQRTAEAVLRIKLTKKKNQFILRKGGGP